MSAGMFGLKTLRAMHRGRSNGEGMRVTFISGDRDVHTGYLVNMGSRLSVHADDELHEDIHPNRVIAAYIV